MRILFVGDVVGRGGRTVLREKLAEVKEAEAIDFTIVNIENAAGGFGTTPNLAEETFKLGADVLTSGNHIWDRRELFDYFDRAPKLLRPGNYPPGLPGSWSTVAESRQGVPVAVVNLQGRVFMPLIDCPFRFIDAEIEAIREQTPIILVDFHAEATSEKMAFGWHVDGRVSAVVGTHTHVPTADCRVLPGGTAYVTDVGMTGSYESVIGMRVKESLQRFLTGLNARFEPATDSPKFCSVIIEIDDASGQALSIRRCDLEPAVP
ncbi:MAG: TIGR00282 family metallophosphoesterase [Acidobacteriota bacterium]|nr:MAG: TIGR00282 family metallophosphoesterase [Acidobacteriota bacterium]